ncbi:helix-turn-helix domain-containing protein [Ruminococcus sp. OA3]|uniref:PucR family transcriptional regulator n=1 Tax=Ruminococcus sp. OA3 TaxID=2914164 RepID=UPI001F06295F|nr:helix-turn-helix domain-containing protein [Ruminococcus sp. OA3]MCH1984510.1 helix-turn-helix domain-containing protein [Ruminococcus sp. OA3]
MELTASLIYETLSATLCMERPDRSFQDIPLKGFLFYPSAAELSMQYLQIISYPTFVNLKDRSGYTWICLKNPEEKPLFHKDFDVIYVNEKISVFELANQLQQFRTQFDRFNSLLLRVQSGLQYAKELFDTASRLTNMEMALIDADYHYLVTTKDFYKVSNFPQTSSMTWEQVTEYNQEKEFKEAFSLHGVQNYSSGNPDQLLYYINIFLNRRYCARLVAKFKKLTFFDGKLSVIEALGDSITHAFSVESSSSPYSDSRHSLYRIVNHIIQGTVEDMHRYTAVLSSYGWEKEHRYQVIKFKFLEEDHFTISFDFIRMQVEALLKNSCFISNAAGIFCVRNLSLPGSEEPLPDNFKVFLRDTLCKIGISNPFTHIYDIQTFCSEADTALSIGDKRAPSFWYYYFSDFIYDYLKSQCVSQYPASELCHPAIRILKQYDTLHPHSCLILTLKALIEHKFNTSHTAEALFIHRTTCIYRLNKIIELTGIDFQNMKQLTHLMISFMIDESLHA